MTEFELNENDPRAFDYAFKGGGGKGAAPQTTVPKVATPIQTAEAMADMPEGSKRKRSKTSKAKLKVPISQGKTGDKQTSQGAGLNP